MRRFRGFIEWITDWRTGATFAATCLVILLGVVIIDGRQARDHALQSVTAQANQARSSQEAATRRIDLLTGEIQNLRTELDSVLSATTDEQRQKAVADAEQRRTSPTTTTTTAPPTAVAANPPASAPQRPSPAPEPPSTTTTTQPSPPTTAPCTTLPLVGTCVPGRASRSAARSDLDWEALRQCESGGDYANKENPKYRGAYQFSYDTWAKVGGEGDPADASPDEQDMRALMLYERSGAGQWPVCGRRL